MNEYLSTSQNAGISDAVVKREKVTCSKTNDQTGVKSNQSGSTPGSTPGSPPRAQAGVKYRSCFSIFICLIAQLLPFSVSCSCLCSDCYYYWYYYYYHYSNAYPSHLALTLEFIFRAEAAVTRELRSFRKNRSGVASAIISVRNLFTVIYQAFTLAICPKYSTNPPPSPTSPPPSR